MLIGAKYGQLHSLSPINAVSIPHTIASQLYFNGTVGSTTFTDHTGKAWTRIGTPSIVDSITDPTARMGYFDGSGDAITTVAHADFAFGTGDFTIEMWASTSSRNSAYECLVDLTSGTTISNGSRVAIFVNTSGTVFTEFRNTAGTYVGQVSVASAWTDNVWHHVALVRKDGVFKIAVDGQFGTSVAYSINYSVNQKVRIGWALNQVAGEELLGWVDNFQVVKGTALFTQNFTPTFTRLATLPLIVSQLYLDGANGGTTFVDQTGKAWTRTGQVVITTAQGFSGGASAYFDGTSDYITTPHHADFNVGAMDFTLEVRCKQEIIYSANYPNLVSKRSSAVSNNSFTLWFHIATNRFVFTASYDGGDPYVSGVEVYGPTITQDTSVWHHVAVVREGTTIRVFCDGVSGPAVNMGTNAIFNSTNALGLGTDGAGGTPSSVNCWRGWLDDFRFIRGKALYTFNRPSPGPYYNDNPQANYYTASLLKFTGANNSTVITDEVIGRTWTVNGAAKVSTVDSKFGGSSLYLDGVAGTYIYTPVNADFNVGSSDFTIECFVKISTLPTTYYGILGNRASASSNFAYSFLINTSEFGGRLHFTYSTSGTIAAANLVGTNTVPLNVWTHVAVSRVGSFMYLFMNGQLEGTLNVGAAVLFSSTVNPAIGMLSTTIPSSHLFKGYIDSFKFTRGLGISSPFIVPTEELVV